jgi:hypothetical protein
MALTTNNAERLRISSTGNVGIGVVPATTLHVKKGDTTTGAILRIQGAGPVAATGRLGDIDFWGGRLSSDTGTTLGQIRVGNASGFYWDGSANREDTYMSFSTAKDRVLTERMRIKSSGSITFGPGPGAVGGVEMLPNYSNGAALLYWNRTTNANTSTVLRFDNQGVARGSITYNSTSTAYNTSSDYRLKEAWVPMTGASERVQALKPINFAWKVDGSRVDGFLAHEAQEVVPECATGTKDAMMDEEYEVTPAVLDDDGNETSPAVMGTRSVPDYQGIDQSKIVPLLTAALQEALNKIDALETRLTSLEESQ